MPPAAQEAAPAAYDVVIIGAGAAGLMCAIEAGKRGRTTLVIEANAAPGKKILISGGGRCNFTNLYAAPENYLSKNPDFPRSALARYTPADFIALVEAHGIPYHEKKLGQLFCDGSARAILDLLEDECVAAGVQRLDGCTVLAVQKDSRFLVETSAGAFTAESLVVATGGLSIPKLGASDLGYRLAAQFGLNIVSPQPGLVPLVCAGAEREFCNDLAGVSLDVVATAGSESFRENLLFTHDGLSGPAILQVSSYWTPGEPLRIDLLPGKSALDILTEAQADTRELAAVLHEHLPRRFVNRWCMRYAASRPMTRYSQAELRRIAELLHAWTLTPAGTRGYGKAEVTVGGVDTNELSSRTMEARKAPGLYFIGEVVDVTGWLGGYNFQWAWASGHAAGQAV